MAQRKKYKLLSNIPCGEDRFEGKSHERIASHIADVLKNNTDIRIIGIEGGWGSGKSNLVSLVEKNLSRDNNGKTYKFFNYDAWGHVTDFQRRSILEELTEFLIEDLQPNEKWEDKRVKLMSKSKTTVTKDIPKINGFLAMFVLLLLISPIIKAIIAVLPSWMHTTGFAAWIEVFVYAVFLCIGFIWYYDQRRLDHDGDDIESDIGTIPFSDIFSVYAKKVNSTTTYEQIHDDEPSSREFREWIKEINQSLPDDKVVVLVFDNMDRLPKKKVQEFWAAIHSFFSTDQEGSLDKIKVIIPFDRNHVNKAFTKTEGEEESYGDDFINKTFNVVYSVPPIIMTQWKAYFSEAWKRAFGAESPVEVTQIFDAFEDNKTPRQIIAFINQCVTIKQTNEGIEDKYIALFIFGKKEIEEKPIEGILNPKFIKPLEFIYRNDEDLSGKLSALYYQLPVNKAVDVVLASRIVRELDNNTPDTLKTNVKNEDFLIRLLENAIPQISNVENAVLSFGSIDLKDSDRKVALWNCLCDVALAKDTITEYKPYQESVFAHTDKRKQYFQKLVTGYLNNIAKFTGESYKSAIDKFSDIDPKVVETYFVSNSFNVEAEKYLEILRACRKDINNYGVKCELSKVDEYLGKIDVISLKHIRGIEHFIDDDKTAKEQLPHYLTNLKKLLDSNKGNPDNLVAIYCHYKELFRPIDSGLWLTDMDLYNLINILKKDHLFYYDVVAMRIARLDSFSTNYRNAFNNILQSTDLNDVKGLSSCIEYYIDYGDLLMNIAKVNYSLVKEVINELTLNSHGISRMNVKEVLSNFDTITKETGIEHNVLFRRFNNWAAHFTPLKADNISITLLKDAMNSNNSLANKIKENVETIYNETAQDDWMNSIAQNDHLTQMWTLYHPHNVQNCFDAYKSLLKKYANGGEKFMEKDFANQLLEIFISLNNDVSYLFDEIYDLLKSRNDKNHLLYFGDWLINHCSNTKQKRFISDLVPTDIMDKSVVEFLLQHPQTLNSTKPQGFIEKLKQLSEHEMKGNEALEKYLTSLKPKKSKTRDKEPD